jgi:hypothetical protein
MFIAPPSLLLVQLNNYSTGQPLLSPHCLISGISRSDEPSDLRLEQLKFRA